MEYPGEVFLVDKPYKWTSFDVVGKLRWLLRYHYGKKVKVGHAGTLDPLATGLLILCSGSETRNIDSYQAAEKEYTGEFFLGATTASYDLERAVEKREGIVLPDEDLIREAVKKLTGTYLQKPPDHSAKWVDGQRAYKLARAGKEVAVKSVEIRINEFEIVIAELPLIRFRISCSKGTYIRSIAHDLGELLGTGAYLHSLCRTRIGNCHLKDASSIEDLISRYKANFTRENLDFQKPADF